MDDFLDTMLKEEPAPASGEAQPQAASQPASPAPAATPAPGSAEPSPTPEGGKPPEPGYVPLAALLDDREKRQKAQAEAEALRAQLAKFTEKRPQPSPSYQDDPDAWARTLEQRMYENKRDTKFEISETFAVEQHGKDVVEAAKTWSEEKAKSEASQYGYSPLVTMIHHQRHPLDWVVKEYQRAKWLDEVGNDRDAWAKKRYAELSAAPDPNAPAANTGGPPQPGNAQTKPAFIPPKSLVHAPSAGGMTKGMPVGPGAAFDAVFPN